VGGFTYGMPVLGLFPPDLKAMPGLYCEPCGAIDRAWLQHVVRMAPSEPFGEVLRTGRKAKVYFDTNKLLLYSITIYLADAVDEVMKASSAFL
jgi:hypothetical protein